MPGGLQRLAQWLGGRGGGPGRTATADREALAALAAAGQGDGPLVRSLTAEMKDFLSGGGPLSRTVTAEMRDILAAAGGAGGTGGLARTGTVDMVSAEALEAEARSLFKHMSIGAPAGGAEVADCIDSVAACAAGQAGATHEACSAAQLAGPPPTASLCLTTLLNAPC